MEIPECRRTPLQRATTSARLASRRRNHARSFRFLLVFANPFEWRRLLWQRRRQRLLARRRFRQAEMEISDWRRRPRFAGNRPTANSTSEVGTATSMRSTPPPEKKSGVSKPAKTPTYTTRSAFSPPPLSLTASFTSVAAIQTSTLWMPRPAKKVVFQQQRIVGHHFAGGATTANCTSPRPIQLSCTFRSQSRRQPIDSLKFYTGLFSLRRPSPATHFTFAGQDGKLIAVDLTPSKPAWTFQTGGLASEPRRPLQARRQPQLRSRLSIQHFYDDMIIGVTNDSHTVGTFLSSPVVSGSAIYFGSADGNLYALN